MIINKRRFVDDHVLPKMMLQKHGGQHSLVQYYSPGNFFGRFIFKSMFCHFFWWCTASPAASFSSLSYSSTSWDSHPSGHVLGKKSQFKLITLYRTVNGIPVKDSGKDICKDVNSVKGRANKKTNILELL